MRVIPWMSAALLLVTMAGCMGGPGDGHDTAVLSTTSAPAICDVVADGTLATGDSFAGSFHADLSFVGTGTWDHWTPAVAVPAGDDDEADDDDGEAEEHHDGDHHDDGEAEDHHDGDHHDDGEADDDEDGGHHDDGEDDDDGPAFVRDHFHGIVDMAFCRPNGVTLIDAGGSGTWNGAPGYTFLLSAVDRRTTFDTYQITITAPDGITTTYSASGNPITGDIVATTY